jgi:RNA polymerase sigma-70 factor (ECF subfamily)
VRSADPSAEERAVLRRYLDAQERGDAEALAAVLRDDLRISFPPLPLWYDGRDAFKRGSDKYALPGDYRFLPAQANGQPTVALYLRAPGDDLYRALVLEVLRIEEDHVVEIIDFSRPDLFPAFGLPMSFPPPRRSNEDDVEAKEVR